MSEHFSNMLVKYQFILINLTAANNRFSFWNFQQPLYEGISTIGYFQPSTLTWLVGTSSSRILPLQGLIQELLPPCIFDVAGQRVLCLKRQGKARGPNLGRGERATLVQIFQFLTKSILGHFSNMMTKYEFILTKLTGRNNQFSFWNFWQNQFWGIFPTWWRSMSLFWQI